MISGHDGGRGHEPASGRADLHTHSTASDGSCSPTELLGRAKTAGLSVVALTDHDTTAGYDEARAAGDALGVIVVAGVELSAVDGEAEVHVLGLHLTERDRLEPALARLRGARTERARAMVDILGSLGAPVSLDAVLAEAGGGAIGRPHVARVLVASGWVRDSREAFDRYLGAGRPACVPKARLTVAEAIGLVHDAGGLAFWAHPGRDGSLSRIEAMQAVGMDGVEVLHPGHTAEDVARIGAIQAARDLLPTGGSDWHGATEGPRVLGAQGVPAEWADRQARRAAEMRRPAT